MPRVIGIPAGVALAREVMGILAGVTMAVGLSAMWIAARRKGKAQQGQPGFPGPLMRAAVRYLGPLPPGASKSVRISWLRRVSVRIALPSIALCVVSMILINETWLYVLFAVLFLAWAESLWGMTRDIKRARRTEAAD